ncbi:ABC transporter ATP-binding protein [Ignisphaera sp. 4213-co]|uniref:ABC transporter ATP-binding protein n=1 Tax=Ignisphaera cupida TaxID=3050454 RepID=A0ABD4Z4L2_9CREN|nr:ABC transporter ATP-binding protein [Ignisphaera sp. 4213-co]MDK6027927.1 ABC transporter ATP-binding protein [Ignisphaera sp. 4213-co]
MVIEIVGVSKSFGRVKALSNVSFTVRNGEVVGYVGLNGAGKTTTIRIAVGVLPPDSGNVFIDGYSVVKEKKNASRLVGWVPELPIFESDFRALDYFTYLAGYYGYSASDARRIGKELLEKLGLGDALKKKLSEYSQGMRKRFALAVSLIGDPPNFVFDEVLNGLDPQGIAFFRNLAIEFRKQNKAVLFSSHILSEVEGIADRVVFIHKGRIVGDYSMEYIRQQAQPAIELALTTVDGKVLKLLEKHGEPVVVSEKRVLLRKPISDSSQIVVELVTAGVGVLEVKKHEKHLEDFFFELIRKAEGG